MLPWRTLGFRRPDVAMIVYSFAVIIFVFIFRNKIPEWSSVIKHHAMLIFLWAGMVRLCERLHVSPSLSAIARMIAIPVALLCVLFREVGTVVSRLSTRTYELELQGIDIAIFGDDPLRLLEPLIHPIAVDIFAVAYASYFFLPFIGAFYLIAQKNWSWLDSYMTSIILGAVLTWVGYLLVPARSPYVAATMPEFSEHIAFTVPITGSVVSSFVIETLDRLDIVHLDAFPSGHVAITCAYLYVLRTPGRSVFFVLLVPAVLLIISTVYLRYHYVIDVLAGLGLGIIVGIIARYTRPQEGS